MKVLIISDAWLPQINGVVRSLEATLRELKRMGHEAIVIGPDASQRCTLRMPFYKEIRLEFFAHSRLRLIFTETQADFIHIATEGPLGWAARSVCMNMGKPFTTSYHTRFPEYIAARFPHLFSRLIELTAYAVLRRFHAPAGAVMVATPSIERELHFHKFRHIVRWSRGVDTNLFRPQEVGVSSYLNLPHPIMLYVGRVAVEKNLHDFLNLKTTGSLIVIGDGPDLTSLRAQYPRAHFLGMMKGEALAQHYAGADLFVFPSTTDTFGLVLLEACASGLRIAAYPAPGPLDLFMEYGVGLFAVLEKDLQKAVNQALLLSSNKEVPCTFAKRYSWETCTMQFFTHLQAPSPQATRKLIRWRKKIGEGL